MTGIPARLSGPCGFSGHSLEAVQAAAGAHPAAPDSAQKKAATRAAQLRKREETPCEGNPKMRPRPSRRKAGVGVRVKSPPGASIMGDA